MTTASCSCGLPPAIAASSPWIRTPHESQLHRTFILRSPFLFGSSQLMHYPTFPPLPPSSIPLSLKRFRPLVTASMTESPLLWAVRTCVLYAFVQLGVAGRTFMAGDADESRDAKWLQKIFGGSEEGKELKKVRNKWQTTTKGTLKRRYRVPTKTEGRRLLQSISSLLSDDDTFRDATSHKGCQIRRENAHAETVCCHNVRAMFDELPTPHLVIEITAFPAGPITTADFQKAEKIEKLLRSGHSI